MAWDDARVDIAEFLAARLDEDERIAQACREPIWRLDPGWDGGVYLLEDEAGAWIAPGQEDGPHIARHDPARALAEVAAKRAIIRNAEFNWSDDQGCDASWNALEAVAQVYADHPDFDPAWSMTVDAP